MISLLMMLLACSGDAAEKGTDPADDTAGPVDSAEPPACATLNSGDNWAWQGECPQMYTPCDIVVTDCTLAIDYAADGGMTMGMPYSGTITDSTITFADGDSVLGCTGTIEDADSVSGSCADGCTFTLRRR